MAASDITRHFSSLSACAKVLLTIEKQYLETGISGLFKRINFSEALNRAKENHRDLSGIYSHLNTSLATDSSLRGVSNFAKSLMDYSSALCKLLEGLAAKANGTPYSSQEYKADFSQLDRSREACGDAQAKIFK